MIQERLNEAIKVIRESYFIINPNYVDALLSHMGKLF